MPKKRNPKMARRRPSKWPVKKKISKKKSGSILLLRSKKFVEDHKKSVFLTGIIFVSLLGFGVKVIFFNQPEVSIKTIELEEQEPVLEEPPKPVTFPSPLTGVEVSKEQSERPLTAFIIENSPEARPQSGLNEAGVVYEAIAEGGITRFVAIYQESAPAEVGPVRSLRPYYLDWLKPYGATVGHVGGSRKALGIVRDGSWRDMDQFSYGKTYWRSNKRRAPHNVYTSFERIDSFNSSKNYQLKEFDQWPRKDDGPAPVAEQIISSVNVKISSGNYNSVFNYEPLTNSYLRSQGGGPHLDAAGVQISAKVVVVMITPYSVVAEIDGSRLSYKTSGTGQAFIFQDGAVQEVTWNKSGASGKLVFNDVNGAEVALNKGKTWVVALNSRDKLSW